jgi:diguanylate cyclase (GGDEF)-like protein/PAS domain S-box-containing protein
MHGVERQPVASRERRPLRRRSSRRLGIRSLSGRILLLLLGPLMLTQFLVFRDLGRFRSAATDATALADRIGVMSAASSVYAPAAFEEMASLAVAFVDTLGVDRSLISVALGFDYDPYIARARTQLDLALDSIAQGYGSMVLADGQPVSRRLGDLRGALAVQRGLLDQRIADGPKIATILAGVIALVDEMASTADAARKATLDINVVNVADEAFQLLSMIQAVAMQTRANSAGLGAPNGIMGSADALSASGVADFTIARYGEIIGADAAGVVKWQQLKTSAAIVRYEKIRPQIAAALAERARIEAAPRPPGTSAFITDAAFIRVLADILQGSFDRLGAFENFGTDRFADLTDHATAIGDRADRNVANWVLVLFLVTASSVILLALTLWTTVRPLRRLTSRALDVGRGEIPSRPLRVVGPSDVRTVTETFNTMVATLGAFEKQLTGLASGSDLTENELTELPGSLGESLRRSVRHLSEVTTQLRESEALATAIIDTANDAIWTVDESGTVLSANASSERLLGMAANSQVGGSLPDLFGGRAEVTQLSGELEFHRPSGKAVHALISQSEVWVEDRLIHAVFARDISDRKRFEERLAFQARHDMLTGLPNRLAVIERLDDALCRARRLHRPVGVLFVDLDGFKAINDSRGHAKGDELLREVAIRLPGELRDTDFVGRLGGDEFLVVTEGLDIDQLAALGERVVTAIGQPFMTADDLFLVSACAGAAMTTGDVDVDGLELVREADVAVYHAKSQGRGLVVVFDDALQHAVEDNAEIEVALRRGIVDGELELYYQPIVDLRSGSPWGAEALVRWNRPGHGQLPPDRFIPVAERSNLIIDLGRWVINSALRTLAEWQLDPARAHLSVAINISGRHLTEGDLVDDLRVALLASGADPRFLEVEITETHLLADLDRANSVLRALRDWGIKVSVDDFGTGYSSMSYLRQLEIDTIKIDRVFVDRIQNPGYDRTIVEVLLQLAAALDLNVVAEGVATAEQLAFLRDRDCPRVQGFYFARPMPLQQFREWAAVWALEASARS